MVYSGYIHWINTMNIEEFKLSITPRQLRFDDTDTLKEGMVIATEANPDLPLMIMSVLNENDLSVIAVDETFH